MKRALILVLTLTALSFGLGWKLDTLQRDTALAYLDGLYAVRQAVDDGRMAQARSEQAYLHALWQHDAHWLNCLIDHHHTRDVDGAMRRLATTLEEENRLAALLTLDEVIDSLEEVSQRDLPIWENIM